MERVFMTTPLVELDGEGEGRRLWRMIKEELIHPFVELEAEYYDLSGEKLRQTGGKIAQEAAEAQNYYGVAVRCCGETGRELILIWARGLRQRAELDGQRELKDFAAALEYACCRAAEGHCGESEDAFIKKVRENMEKALQLGENEVFSED